MKRFDCEQCGMSKRFWFMSRAGFRKYMAVHQLFCDLDHVAWLGGRK